MRQVRNETARKERSEAAKTAAALLLRSTSFALFAVLLAALAVTPAHSMAPSSAGTLVVALEVDRDGARLVGFAAKARPFAISGSEEGRSADRTGLEVSLLGPGGAVAHAHVDLDGLCFAHGPHAEPHVQGDRIRMHRDTVTIELPLVPGADTLDVAVAEDPAALALRTLASLRLDPEHFDAPASELPLAALALGSASTMGESGSNAVAGTPVVHWPEQYGDPDRVRVYGDPVAPGRRINIVIVPDGYTYAQKSLLQAHADALVAAFRARTPYTEHDTFINYDLVYAYSTASGTDQCDCGNAADTAMGTRFPAGGGACGSQENRCLYYGTANGGPDCDANTSAANIAAAELRAPARDTTIVMVNTTRYGGCGGMRAVYSAGNAAATEIAIHELGHALAGLYDEYDGYSECGADDGPNVSTNGTSGNWPEWTGELGTPREGASTYDSCVFRPSPSCEMRTLGQPFCKVCAQRFALTFFGHSRVRDTAPIESQSPAATVAAAPGTPVHFSVGTRLAVGPSVTNRITWRLRSPGNSAAIEVASGSPSLTWTFPTAGVYTLTCEVAADSSFIKPQVEGANVDVATWTVTAGATCSTPLVFGGIRAIHDLDLCAESGIRIEWDAATFGPSGGTYELTRDALALGAGLTTLSYVDHPGDGLAHAYRVRAVSPDCGSTSGAIDVASATDLTHPTVLLPLGNLLFVTKSGRDVRIRWSDAGTAESYDVAAGAGVVPVALASIGTATNGTTGLVDPGASASTGSRSYRVLQARCGVRSAY